MAQVRGVGVVVSSGYPTGESLFRLFEGCVGRFGQRLALRFRDEALTYAQLYARVESVAVRLVGLGVRPGEPVALMTARSVEMVVGIWAILRVGGTYVPIDTGHPAQRVESILRDSGARVCLTVAMIRAAQGVDADGSVLPSVGAPVGPAYIMYTSGSTGAPKGIAVAHHSVTRTVMGTNYVAIEPKDNVLGLVNYAFDGSVFDIFGALLNGATLVVPELEEVTDPDRLAAVIDDAGISIAMITTALFNAYVDHDPMMFASLRKVLFGGERASAWHVQKALTHLGAGKLVHVYGPTEATVFSTAHSVDVVVDDVVPIGKPLSNTALHVLDGDRQPVAVGVVGELYIGGDGVALGYWGDPGLTCQRFVPDPWVPGAVMYRSGDLVKVLDRGDLVYVGRGDEQIKLRGFRIEPEEIEARLLEHGLVGQCAVIVTGDHLVAFYTCAVPVDDTALKSHLRATLPHYMVPDHFVCIEALPLTRNGKVDRHQLATHTTTPQPRTSPRHGTKREEVHRIFAEVLGVPEVGDDEGFSEVGGNSITAMTLASKLKRAGYNVTVRDILHCQTIDNLLEETSEPSVILADSHDVGLVKQPGMLVDGDVARLLTDSLATNNDIITGATVAKEYPLSAMQKLQIGFETPASLAIEPLQRVLDLPALQKAYGALVAQHGLLRSVPVESAGSRVWREYDYRGDEVPLIPVIDVNECAEAELTMQALVENLTTRVYKGPKILHQLVVAVIDGNKYFLVWIMSHVIFDRVTKEVLSRQLVRHYDSVLQDQPVHTEAPSFEDYVHHLARGPQGVDAQDIVRLFRLHDFYEAKQKTKNLVAATGSLSSTNFNIVLPLSGTWQLEHPWEVALAVHVKGLQRYLQMDELPLLFVTEGRQFENQRYYDTVGELTDMIPLFVDARMPMAAITRSILDRLEFVKRHNVNFLHLATEPAAQAEWSEVKRLMDIGEDFEHLDILMFNILGYTDEFSVESVVETIWVHPQPLPIQTLLNSITGVCADTLVCTFRTSCEVDVPRIRACFKGATAELS